MITEGTQTTTLDQMAHSVGEDIAFQNTIITELGKIPPDRTSDNWKDFCVKKYDDILAKYKLDRSETRILMLADAMQLENDNRSSPEQLKSKEYKTVVNLALQEWETWKRKNNVAE